MSVPVKIELTEKAKAVLRTVQTLPDWGMAAVCRGMDLANQVALANIQKAHLTGKGPFPVESHRLGVVTNLLRGSARATAATASGTQVTSAIGTNVVYAGPHEFGGTIHHKARTGTARLRTDSKGNLLHQAGHANLAMFAKASHKQVKKVDYKAEEYDVEIPERAPFRTGIEEVLDEYGRMVSKELVAAWKTQA